MLCVKSSILFLAAIAVGVLSFGTNHLNSWADQLEEIFVAAGN